MKDNQITPELLHEKGFKKVNNSMWRNGVVTLQNTYIVTGESIVDRLLSIKPGYKCCCEERFLMNISTEKELDYIIEEWNK